MNTMSIMAVGADQKTVYTRIVNAMRSFQVENDLRHDIFDLNYTKQATAGVMLALYSHIQPSLKMLDFP
jgi:hypothetical protein